MELLKQLNEWAMDFAPLIQLMMMLAVTAATVTALWATWRSRQDQNVQIEYVCDISSIQLPTGVADDGTSYHEHSHTAVTATLTNIGLRPAKIPWLTFGMIIPLVKMGVILNPTTDYRAEAPLPLNPGECKSFLLRSPNQIREEILGLPSEYFPKWFPRMRIRWLRLTFATEGGDVFRAKIGKTLRAHINKTAAQTNWIYQKSLPKTGAEEQK